MKKLFNDLKSKIQELELLLKLCPVQETPELIEALESAKDLLNLACFDIKNAI
jgi:hypothetical protein